MHVHASVRSIIPIRTPPPPPPRPPPARWISRRRTARQTAPGWGGGAPFSCVPPCHKVARPPLGALLPHPPWDDGCGCPFSEPYRIFDPSDAPAHVAFSLRHGCFGLETKVLKRIYGITQSKQCLISSLSLPFCDICFEISFLPNTTLLSYLNVAPTYSIAFLTEHTFAHQFYYTR